MEKTTIRLLIALLIVTLMLPLMAACGGAGTGDGETKSQETKTDETGETQKVEDETEARPDYLLTLPEADYQGEVITFLCRSNKIYEIYSEQTSGDLVQDAILDRNGRIQDRYHVTIDYLDVPGTWNEQSQFLDACRKGCLTNDGDFDAIAGYLAYTSKLAMEGLFANLYSIDTVHPQSPWWAKGYVDNNTINECLYFSIGDISLTMWEYIYAVFYNKSIGADNDIPDLYQMVLNKEWTLENFIDLTERVSTDLNGDLAFTNQDLYGLITNRHSVRTFVTSCDIPICERTDEGGYELVYYSEKLVDLYSIIEPFVNRSQSVYFSLPQDDSDHSEMITMFMADQGMFMTETLETAALMRNMKSDYSILPFPLYDDLQKNYKAHAYDGLSIFAIPSSIGDRAEMTGMIMEAMCAESAYSVIPVFYDSVMSLKVARDEQSREMLGLIRDSLFFDFGFIHAVPIGGLFQLFGDEVVNKTPSITSTYKSNEGKYLQNLADIVDQYFSIE